MVVQGAYRSNMGIIGLALCANAYGEQGLIVASLYVGLVTILFNVLAVITLSRSLQRRQGIGRMLKGIARNPLIIGILLAMPVSIGDIELPTVVLRSVQYVADLTLPLALICTGASLNFKTFQAEIRNTLLSSGLKTGGGAGGLLGRWHPAWLPGYRTGRAAVDVLRPTAAASYVMVRARWVPMRPLVANIIVPHDAGFAGDDESGDRPAALAGPDVSEAGAPGAGRRAACCSHSTKVRKHGCCAAAGDITA